MPWARSFCPFRACGDMMVFWYLRRVGTWWCSNAWGVWGHDGVLMPGACGDMMVFWCLGRVGAWWCSDAWGVWGLHDGVLMPGACGAYLRNLNAYFCTQAYAADYSSGSVSLFKWLNQLTQVVQSAYSSGSISLLKWLNQRVQPSAQPDAVEFLTRRSHILNPVQPHQLVNGSTLFVYLIWVLNDYQGELAFLRVPSGTITGTIRDNHEFYDMPEWLPGRILKIQGTEYHIVRCRFFFPILYQVYYIYTFTSFTLYVIREEKDFFSTFQLLKCIFSLQKFA